MPHDARHGHALKLHRFSGFGEVSNSGAEAETPENAGFQRVGTLVAIGNLALGVPANFDVTPGGSERAHRERCSERTAGGRQRQCKRGGARNRRNRESLSLTAAQVTNLTAAAAQADRIGLPLNRMITLHWESAGVPLDAMAKATGRFIDLLSKALTRHGSRTAWVFVHEAGKGKGGHAHVLAHVPQALAGLVARRQRSWLKRITGKPYKARVIFGRPIAGAHATAPGAGDLYAVNLDAALSYLTKGADEPAAERFGLTRLEPGGRVIGKRCGVSQNIGPKARRESDA